VFKKLRIFFEHNKAERNGTIVILVIAFIALIATVAFTEYYTPPQKDLSELAAYVKHKESQQLQEDTVRKQPFDFNPNTLSDSGYLELGFSEKEIQTLRNYQKAGANFKVKSDFKKLFFVDSTEYNRLKPFIQLPDSIPLKSWSKKNDDANRVSWSDTASYKPYIERSKIELNSADTNELKSLKGIGSFYANEIVKYRSELGGYYNLGQLLELWKMEPSKIDVFADQVYIDTDLIQTVKINRLTSQELARHPYINLHLASKLIYSRESDGIYKNLDDLKNRKLVNEELSSKLAPYLDFK